MQKVLEQTLRQKHTQSQIFKIPTRSKEPKVSIDDLVKAQSYKFFDIHPTRNEANVTTSILKPINNLARLTQ